MNGAKDSASRSFSMAQYSEETVAPHLLFPVSKIRGHWGNSGRSRRCRADASSVAKQSARSNFRHGKDGRGQPQVWLGVEWHDVTRRIGIAFRGTLRNCYATSSTSTSHASR